MALGILAGLGSLLGIGHSVAELGAVQVAGQAQQDQAVHMLQDNLRLNTRLGKELNDASNYGISSNAAAGKYSILQNSQAAYFETQLKLANKWMQVLSG